MRPLMALAALAALVLALASPAAGKPYDPCRGYACLHLRHPHHGCPWRAGARNGYTAEQRRVRCEVIRATRHFSVSRAAGLYVSYRESKWTEVGTNYAGYRGPFQMSSTLIGQTPYRAHDPNRAHWASLAYAWTVAHGGACNWAPPSYCG